MSWMRVAAGPTLMTLDLCGVDERWIPVCTRILFRGLALVYYTMVGTECHGVDHLGGAQVWSAVVVFLSSTRSDSPAQTLLLLTSPSSHQPCQEGSGQPPFLRD